MIPVSRPILDDVETMLASEVVASGQISGTSGRFIEEFEYRFAEFCGTKHAVACSSGSTALHLACAAIGLKAGDEVLVSAATNIASANAVALCGATVVPVDCEPDSWQMDPSLLRELLTSRTKAIMPVHLFGHPVDMGPVVGFARAHGLEIIEDCAEAHGAEYRGQRVGSFGSVGCFSFYANKMITTGEGGMCTTDRRDVAERLRSLRNLAFGQPRFLHHEIGFNYRMTNLQAAIGCAQMQKLSSNIEKKRALASAYTDALKDCVGLKLPVERPWAKNVYWMYGLTVGSEFGMSRDQLMAHLRGRDVETRTMFCPMNLQPALRRHLRSAPCPEAERLWVEGLYLPSAPDMTGDEVSTVTGAIREVAQNAAVAR